MKAYIKSSKMSQKKKEVKSSATRDDPLKLCPASRGYKMEQALVSEYVPVVIHPGEHKPDCVTFAIYNPNYSNSYNPFYTLQKPTCGYRYCPHTDHRRKVLDVERVNIPKWRTIVGKKPGIPSQTTER